MSELDAAATDPRANGLMQGFPPAAGKLIQADDNSAWRFPGIRWAFSHERQLNPTANVRRGSGAASILPYALRDDIDDVSFTSMDGRTLTWRQSLDVNYTDGIVVLHRGAVIYETYLGALQPELPHLAMSVTKSFVGLLAAMLAEEGKLDPNAPVAQYVPELAPSAYGDASVRQVMDMTIGVKYTEDYTDRSAEIFDYTLAIGLVTRPADYKGPKSIFEFLQGLKKQGEHGEAFAYKTCNTEVLAWIVQRVANTPIAHLVSERIWQKLGVEEDAYFIVDRTGSAMCGGGLNLTLRDMARFGEMMRCDGAANGQQIAPAKVVADIRSGADRDHFAKAKYSTLQGWSYRDQWWVAHDNLGSFTARGIHGQVIWVAPAAELVIARFGSHHVAANANGPLDHVSLPAYRALAEHVMRS
jgi:CubicO group peptidase (beta-lactamase class C family)